MSQVRTSALAPMARLFKALGDPTRLRILGLLVTGEVCVCHLHGALAIPQPKASRHLAYLRRAGLVAARRDGLWMHYRLVDAGETPLAVLRSAITRALRGSPEVAKDLKRLQRLTGCCIPAESGERDCPPPDVQGILSP